MPRQQRDIPSAGKKKSPTPIRAGAERSPRGAAEALLSLPEAYYPSHKECSGWRLLYDGQRQLATGEEGSMILVLQSCSH